MLNENVIVYVHTKLYVNIMSSERQNDFF